MANKKRRRRKRNENPFLRWLRDVVGLIADNKGIAASVLGFVVLAVIAAVLMSAVSKKRAEAETTPDIEDVAQNQVIISEEPMEVDAYEGINSLMRKYYDAAAIGDINTIKELRSSISEKEEIIIKTKANYIESYPTVTCYTKKGPTENTFLVFAYYEVKMLQFDSTAPGLNGWYVCQREDGSYYINEEEQSQDLEEYCKIVSVQDDVVDLNNTVNVKFNEAMEQDPELAKFFDMLPDVLNASVGEELAKTEEDATTTPDDTATQPDEQATDSGEPKQGRTTDKVNLRASDSIEADSQGQVEKGKTVTVLERKANGWAKVEVDGKEGYIKSEYIQVEGEEAPQTEPDEEALANSPSSGKGKTKESVNLREKASTDANKIVLIPGGEEVKIITKQNDGWTKAEYDGKVGYIKSEYLE